MSGIQSRPPLTPEQLEFLQGLRRDFQQDPHLAQYLDYVRPPPLGLEILTLNKEQHQKRLQLRRTIQALCRV
jgi:hypothetical protein